MQRPNCGCQGTVVEKSKRKVTRSVTLCTTLQNPQSLDVCKKKKKPRKQTKNTRVHSRSSYKLGEFPTFPCLYLKQRSWKESAKGLEIFQQVWKVHDWEGPWPISKPAKPLPNPFPLGSPAFLFPAIDLIKKEKGIPWPLNLRSQCTTKTLCWSAKGKQNAVA